MTGPRIGVDVGGTFTDVTLVTDGDLVTAKVPSTADQSEGVVAGIAKACDEAGVAPDDIETFTHAMTVSVNALLERDGATTGLVATEGFGDVLEIGRQTRPSLYDLDAEKPPELVPRRRRFEVSERATSEGIETPVDPEEVRAVAADLREAGVESVAVAFLHAYAHPENERAAAEILRDELDVPVSASHEVLAEFREYERTATTAVDAYVTPKIDAYVGRLEARAAEMGVPEPRIMQSNGGIADARTVRERAVTTVLSGPAAGVVGASRAAADVRADRDLAGLVTFDMGGTSSDVSLVRGDRAERTTDTTIDGVPIRVPMVDVHTIGSGGGSLARVDSGGALRVGPESAGAEPGPACYGKGGERATITDANVVLGYIGASTALGGELELDETAARDALADLADEAGLDSALDAARGVYDVANAKMIRAIRSVTVERGYDPREFGLVAFGGAGGLHAPALADALDIDAVVVPVAGGVLSAYGLLDADEQHDAVRTHLVSLADADTAKIDEILGDLRDEVLADVGDESAADAAAASAAGDSSAEVRRSADCRYAGQSFELSVPISGAFDPDDVREKFHEAHDRAYGYRVDEDVEVVNLRATARIERGVEDTAYDGDGESYLGTREAHFSGELRETEVHDRLSLAAGASVEGPAVLEQAESTTVVPPGWTAEVQGDGTVVLLRGEGQ
ncbi:hydantoinase/oxoprolinase family protein [Halorussus amylolyticus]|uniref:hydantoinase/oxoprolinase family protein n=1 Tax=Halorussus amylolyticus TaxID=1126242 RepID=UPI001049DD07|nr:hydantoinase/oxoprolinase family protein [Halorussus amylolyticus]